MKNQIKINRSKAERFLYTIVLGTLIASVIFIIIRIIQAPVVSDSEAVRTKSSYTLMLSQCILGIVAIHIPDIFERRIKYEIPSFMIIMYIIFLYCAIYLGEVRNFYYQYHNWDALLHTFSGGMLGALGFAVVNLLNKTDEIPMDLSPFFVALFAFCFAITIGVFWEFYEFAFDKILGLNMQKFMLENGTMLVGRAALTDTMMDLVVDAIGAFVMSSIGYVSIKYSGKFIKKIRFIKIEDKQ